MRVPSACLVAGVHKFLTLFLGNPERQTDPQWVAGATSEESVGRPTFICLWALSVNARMNITKKFGVVPSHKEKLCVQKTKAESRHPSLVF